MRLLQLFSFMFCSLIHKLFNLHVIIFAINTSELYAMLKIKLMFFQCFSADNKFHLARKWRKEKIRHYKQRVLNEESLGNCFVTAIAAFCSQGSYIHSPMLSIRILMMSFLLFGMIMYNAYSALLVSQVLYIQ